MAREEHDREDLLREATALVERVELRMSDGVSVVAGFRRDGSAAFYFGADFMAAFNTDRLLRRAHGEQGLLKAERAKLVLLVRQREADKVVLSSHECSAQETGALLDEIAGQLSSLLTELERRQHTLVGQVPADAPVLERLTQWLRELPMPISIADRPNAG